MGVFKLMHNNRAYSISLCVSSDTAWAEVWKGKHVCAAFYASRLVAGDTAGAHPLISDNVLHSGTQKPGYVYPTKLANASVQQRLDIYKHLIFPMGPEGNKLDPWNNHYYASLPWHQGILATKTSLDLVLHYIIKIC